METLQALLPSARFFGLNLPQAVFTLLSQGGLILVMMTMLWRRWRRNESHLLGKFTAVGFFAWIQLVLLGNSLPLMDRGDLFPSREFGRKFGRIFQMDDEWMPEPGEAMAMIGLYGLVTLGMVWWITLIIAPSRDCQIRGWRRARKVGASRLGWFSDASTCIPWILIMVAMGTAGWSWFAHALIGSRWFPGFELAAWATPAFALILGSAGLVVAAMLESKGMRPTMMAAIFGGVVPMMLGIVLGITSDALAAPATWCIGICPISWPFHVSVLLVPIAEISMDWRRPVPYAFWFWQAIAFVTAIRLLIGLWRARNLIAALVAGGETSEEPDRAS
jgi:hypothetical protein